MIWCNICGEINLDVSLLEHVVAVHAEEENK